MRGMLQHTFRFCRNFALDTGPGTREVGRVAGGASGGSALAEFAIAFPFQLFLTFGLIQFMLLLISGLMVNFAAFRCCRAAMVYAGSENPATAIKPVAQMILAPLSIASHKNTDVPSGWTADSASAAVTIPGWGEIRGSEANINKIKIDITDKDGVVKVKVTYLQELIFPFVDQLFALATHQAFSANDRSFAGASESSGGIWVSSAGRVHYVLTRQHVMRRDSVVSDVGPGSGVYEYKCDGW